MNKSTNEMCKKLDQAMYFAHVIIFDFDAKGISTPFFQTSKYQKTAD